MRHIKRSLAALKASLAALGLLCSCLTALAAPVTYPGPQATDTTGASVTTGLTVSVASVTDLDNNAIASPGAVAHVAGGNLSVVYDAAAKGEAWITLTPSATGHTFAPVVLFCSADPQTLASANTQAAGANTAATGVRTDYTTARAAKIDNLDAAISTRSTYSGGAVASVTGSVGSVTSPVTVGANNDKTGYTVSTVQDKTGYSATATNFVASPTVPQIAAGILLTPSNLLATDGSNRVTTSNPATGGSGVTEASIWSYATRTLTAQSDSPGVTTLLGRPAQTGDAYGLLSPLVSAGKFTAPALSNAPASTFPGDYQQRGVAVTLPTTAPSGYGGSGAAPTVGQIAAAILATPSNLLATDSSGRVTTSNPATGGGGADPLANPLSAYTTAGTVGYALAAALPRIDAPVSGVPAAVAGYNLAGSAGTLTHRVAGAISASVQGGSYLSGALNTGTHQQTVVYYLPGTTLAAMNAGTAPVIDTALVTYDSTNTRIVSRVDTPGTF